MNKESQFEINMKWIILGLSAVGAVCQLILLFTEFNSYSGIGMICNALFHIVAAGAFALIFFQFFSGSKDKEVLTNYGFAAHCALGAIVDLCLMGRVISYTNKTEFFSTGLVICFILLFLLEAFLAFLFIRYALDRLTCILPILFTLITCIMKGVLYGSADSKLYHFLAKESVEVSTEQYIADSVSKEAVKTTINVPSVHSVWTFLALMFLFLLVVAVYLYFDNQFLSSLIHDPKSIFSKKAVFETFTNQYIEPERKEQREKDKMEKMKLEIELKKLELEEREMKNREQRDRMQADLLRNTMELRRNPVCTECGCPLIPGQAVCGDCGCPIPPVASVTPVAPVSPASQISPAVSSNPETEPRICPDCGCPILPGQIMCPDCGCPI